jgi:uncharacterized membrane protein YraQ (UPF0718 family)/copper chaperone CopZ
MTGILTESWNTLCLLAPWLLLGALLAGVLHVALPPDWLRRHLRGPWGVFQAVLLGVPLPLCSCGVIPAGIGLKKSGASDGACLGFLISTPQTGVDSILVSANFLGWPFAIFKMLLAAVTGIAGGLLAFDTPAAAEPSGSSATGPTGQKAWPIRLLAHALDIIQSIWKWLVAGILVSAAISVWIVPTTAFQQLGDAGIVASLLVMLLISLPLYVCATASVPIAAALVAGGMPVAAALVFLIAGPATNFATMGAIYSQFGMRNTVVYLVTIVTGSMAGALVFDLLWGHSTAAAAGHLHESLDWFSVACGILLLGLLGWFLANDLRFRLNRLRGSRATAAGTPSRVLVVNGMKCTNCVHKLESSLMKTPHVEEAHADLESGTVKVGGVVAEETLRKVIEEAGFTVRNEPVKSGNF